MKVQLTLALVCVCVCTGFDFSLPDVRVATDSDQLLTCKNTELSANSSLVFSLAVTITRKAATLAGHTPGLYNWFAWWEAPFTKGTHGGLSAQVELLNTVKNGRGLLAFTTRAQPENLCQLHGKADFGPNFVSKHFDARPEARKYDNLLLGHAMGWGYGAGYTMGMGGFVNNYGSQDDDGVVAEIPLIAGRVSTLNLDRIPFKHIGELAGRGVLVCSKVSATSTGHYVCEKPFYACCQLHYDSQPASLHLSTGIHDDGADVKNFVQVF